MYLKWRAVRLSNKGAQSYEEDCFLTNFVVQVVTCLAALGLHKRRLGKRETSILTGETLSGMLLPWPRQTNWGPTLVNSLFICPYLLVCLPIVKKRYSSGNWGLCRERYLLHRANNVLAYWAHSYSVTRTRVCTDVEGYAERYVAEVRQSLYNYNNFT